MSTEDTPATEPDDPMWMVVTLKSGAQLRTMVTEYEVTRNSVNANGLHKLSWERHPDGPTRPMWIDLSEVAAVHTEYIPPPSAWSQTFQDWFAEGLVSKKDLLAAWTDNTEHHHD